MSELAELGRDSRSSPIIEIFIYTRISTKLTILLHLYDTFLLQKGLFEKAPEAP